jgi:hypothetical protein
VPDAEDDGRRNQSSGKPSSVFHGSNGMGCTGVWA